MKKELDVINCKKQYLGVGFIKSRKSESKVMDMGEEMIAAVQEKGLKILEIIVDDTSGIDVDRPSVDRLTAWMEKDYISAIVVRNIFDITNDLDDLRKFMCKAEGLNVSIYSLECGMNLAYIPWDGGSGC
ncbi:MAG: recombinase family protein [Lachnospiraceae bacterium]|nr:recombinase family protein [Lachnospiraceae bacterium]